MRAASRSEDWASAYEQLLAAAEGRSAGTPPKKVPSPAVADRVRKSVEKKSADPLTRAIMQGKGLDRAVAERVRALLKDKRTNEAQSLADALVRDESTAAAGHLAAGIVAASRSYHSLAVHHFDAVDDEQSLSFAPLEKIQTLFRADSGRGIETARTWLAENRTFSARTWFEVYRNLFVVDELDLADQAFAKTSAAYATPTQQSAWKSGHDDLAWGERWVGSGRLQSAPATPEGHVSFGLIDYLQPGRARASQNIGDQIQTLASLGHVVRHQDLRFHGEEGVVDFVRSMQERVRPELRREGVSADVDLLTIDRDSSTYQQIPPNTWLLEFGWHMHAMFGLGVYDFPLHPNLNPIFVSFHCSKRALLSEESLAYLREHGPIGCRDWTTVDLLLSLDVPAFFSGCLTTTVNTVFPDLEGKPEEATVYVDVARSPVPKGHENVRQSYPEIKKRDFTANMWDAVQVLERYRREYTDVVTTRLHCYLPTTSLGLKVDFEPKNNADVRFNGLFRLSQTDFDAMRSRMRDRLQPVLEAIFRGEDRASVYALWRETVEPEVQQARERHSRSVTVPAVGRSAGQLVASVQRQEADGPANPIDVVLTPTAYQVRHLAAVLRSAAESSSRTIRAWIVARGAGPARLEVEGVEIRWVDTASVDANAVKALDERSLDRVLLPELVPVDRAILLPVDGVVSADLAELEGIDLGEALFAARRTSRADASGFAVLYGAAKRLDSDPVTAYEFYRDIHGRHVFDFDAFDTDVMVLDLAGLRAAGFSDQAVPAMAHYRLDDRDALHYVAGPRRADLGAEWAHVPDREPLESPKARVWAEGAKPWSSSYVTDAELWEQYSSK
ncbi:hypothetical protein [Brachybacterium kimchii]|uniref:Uncharacterized protein n=1 Tax=Brachybacterium kimchii TaxID=2942909 RepID=A0ABY4N0I1_9MICO|nr:hypothetical protein [Brachybacterium kimchii]UQN28067.1 hypothetical protein M4486_10415 [Brachybacterium kimchii]